MNDLRYVVRKGTRLAFQGRNSVALILGDSAMEMTVDLLLVAMVFSEPATVAQAFAALDIECDMEDFAQAVRALLDRGIIESERQAPSTSLLDVLAPRVDWERLTTHLRRGDLVVIPEAFPPDFAREVQRDLLTTYWKTGDGQGFLYSSVESLDGRSDALTRVHDLWQASKPGMAALSGEDCDGESRASASWYRPRDYASPHDDSASRRNSVAFNWYLSENWKVTWGGSLFWGPTGQHVFPLFNTVVLWKVLPSNVHAVCSVSPHATSRRIAVNGFWKRSVAFDPLLAPSVVDAPLVTRRSYDVGDGSTVVVL